MILELKEMVPLLTLCQDLRATEFPQDTYFQWEIWSNGDVGLSRHCDSRLECARYVAAPTLGEMREWLLQQNADPDDVSWFTSISLI